MLSSEKLVEEHLIPQSLNPLLEESTDAWMPFPNISLFQQTSIGFRLLRRTLQV